MDSNLALEFVQVAELAAIAAARMIGRGDADGADQAAVVALLAAFNQMPMNSTVVIGEGERDEAPMLFIGERVGTGEGPVFDIALDPLECTNSVAYGKPNSLAVLAVAPEGRFLHAPDTYMEKIAVGPDAAGVVDVTLGPEENLKNLAKVKGVPVEELTAVILDRERHEELIQRVRGMGCRIKLITDGDVSAAISTSTPGSNVDILMGIGGAPEGVLAAAALRCLGGDMQARLAFRNDNERERTIAMGTDPDKVFEIHDLAAGDDILFVATGITPGDYLDGVNFSDSGCSTETMFIHSATGTFRIISAEHRFDWSP